PPAPISPSTSLSISNCSTASATARRKSPSPAFSSSSASTNLSSVIVSPRMLQVEVLQLHLSRPDRCPPQPHRRTLRVHPIIPPPAGTFTVDKVTRWRIGDLCRWVEERWGVSYSDTGMLRVLRSLDLSHRKTRPRHPQSNEEAQQAFKKRGLLLA